MDKASKNWISLIILLLGLWIGSLFVDIVQYIKGSGFSRKSLRATDIFQSDNKTWVAYNEPIVDVKAISDEKCLECDPKDILMWLRSVMPTISPQKIDYRSPEGEEFIKKYNIKSLPAFVLSKEASSTDLFAQANGIFEAKDQGYLLRTQDLGMIPGKFLGEPQIASDDIKIGKDKALVRVFVFADFQCPYCKAFWFVWRSLMKEYGDRAQFIFKNLPLAVHRQSNEASLATYCANEQNKFWEFGDQLFARQREWDNDREDFWFNIYAQRVGMDVNQFGNCLQSKKYQSQIDAISNEAESLGITGAPAIFVNDQFKNGAIDKNNLRDLIETKLHDQ